MHKKSLETILYSSAGIVVMLGLVIALNVIAGAKPVRVDMTQEKLYTLSPGTRAVLKELTAPVKIRFYCTQGANATPETVFLKDYARQVMDLLQEYQQVAGNKLILQKFDPEPDTDAEDSARLDGLQPQQLSDGDDFYLGLSVSLADTRAAIPFLSPNRQKLLEYDITRAISQVIHPQKPIIGVMSALPVFGAPGNPMMAQMGQAGTSPWTLIQELQQDFNVHQIPMDAANIDNDVKVLVVIHPQGISDETQYAIDQFVLRGGKLIAFLDPMSAYTSRQHNPMEGGPGGDSSTLDKLLPAWGLQFDTGKVIADLDFKMQLRGPNDQPVEEPAWLALTSEGINRNDIATSELDSIWLPLCGAFTGEPAAGLKETVLLHSSKDAELTDAFLANMGGQNLLNSFKPTGVNYKLAVQLTGKFKTAFPEGNPADTGTNATANAAGSLKESQTPTSVVLVGDSDLLAGDFSLQKEDTPFGELVSPLNANLDLAQNLVEEMAGDKNLIGIRSRASMDRPFTRVKQMEAAAEASGEAKIAALQQSLQQTQERLSELQQQKKDANQRYILSPEQQTEIENFRKQEADVSRELRQAQKDLRKQVVSLETHVEWINILAMPLAVTLAGIGIAVFKRRRTSAK
jgi:gliding motility-associatede transport system auxiliary component